MLRNHQQSSVEKAVGRCLLLCALLLAVGCGQGGGLKLAAAEGVVTYQGKALDHGEVVFSPQAGTPGPASVGKIQPDGSYVMRTTGREGAAIGPHKVTVHCRRELTEKEIRNRSLAIPKSLIPGRYGINDQSPLAFEVVEGESNTYDIVLK
jgi:hypothetical protein